MFDAWKQRQRQRLANRPERTVFYNIFATMMLVLTVELLMAAVSILAVNVTGKLEENAKDLLTMRVRNRASYVQEILRNAEDLEQLSEQITATTQQLLKSGDISLDTLDNSSEQSDALLVALAPRLLDALPASLLSCFCADDCCVALGEVLELLIVIVLFSISSGFLLFISTAASQFSDGAILRKSFREAVPAKRFRESWPHRRHNCYPCVNAAYIIWTALYRLLTFHS